MQTIKPAKGYIFGKKLEADNKTDSGILIQSVEHLAPPQLAIVINSSADGYSQKDKIMFKSYTANDVELDKEKYIVLHEEDILGKVEDIDAEKGLADLEEIKALSKTKVL